MQNRSVFVIIVTYNGAETIAKCLESLDKNNHPVHLVVIDNASSDETPDIVKKYSNIIFLPQLKNLGFGRANNIGIQFALQNNADYVFLLNQDAIIENGTVELLLDYAQNHPEYGILSPIHLNGRGVEIDSKVAMYLTKDNNDYLSDLYFHRKNDCYDVRFINAAAWLIPRSCLQKVGGFDPLFFMYGEDVDYCDRVHHFGFKIGVVPNAKVLHYRSGTQLDIDWWKNIQLNASIQAAQIKAGLMISKRPFIQTVMLWMIDHNAIKFRLLVKGHFGDLLVAMIAGIKVILAISVVMSHKRISRKHAAFLDS